MVRTSAIDNLILHRLNRFDLVPFACVLDELACSFDLWSRVLAGPHPSYPIIYLVALASLWLSVVV
jgi:hypothetical protein